jgi:hypothetical protein
MIMVVYKVDERGKAVFLIGKNDDGVVVEEIWTYDGYTSEIKDKIGDSYNVEITSIEK